MSRFEELSDYDFERLLADLLSNKWGGVTVDDFPRGRDGGVDLRVLGPTGGPLGLGPADELVVQCKHRPRATFAQIRRELENEATKAIIDSSARYVIATSARLTRKNKQDVVAIFSDRIAERDVLGANDIEGLLRRYPKVEQAHPKLWISGAAVVRTLLSQIESLQSASLITELNRLRRVFVETPVLDDALTRLEESGVCMLVGPPGVGKTATAHMIILRLMAQGWEPITASAEVRQLEVQLKDRTKQALLFDDFLGQNAIDRLSQGQDSELLRLIRMVEQDPTKLLILTTREFVFQQARQRFEKLGDELFDVARIAVQLPALSWKIKAHILYNQLYYSPIRSIAAAAPNASSRYFAISRHPKFNPRLTQAVVNSIARELGLLHRRPRLNAIPAVQGNLKSQEPPGKIDVPTRLEAGLDSPRTLWDHILMHQLTDLQRALLLVRVSFGSQPIFLQDLYECVKEYTRLRGQPATLQELDDSLAVLDGDFIAVVNRTGRRQDMAVESIDPGLADSLIDYLRRYQDVLRDVALSAVSFSQVSWVARLCVLTPTRHADWVDMPFWTDLTRAAEKCLDSSSSVATFGLVPASPSRQPTFSGFGDRLRFLVFLYRKTQMTSSRAVADRVVPRLVANIRQVEVEQLVPLARALDSDQLSSWGSHRTDARVAILDQLEYPEDIEAWQVLRQVMNEMAVTPEYEQDAERRLESFLDEQREQLLEQLDDEYVDLEYEMDQLKDLASTWGTYLDDSDIAEEIERRSELEPSDQSQERIKFPRTLVKQSEAASASRDSTDGLFDNL